MDSLDTIVFATPLVRAAKFRCNADDPRTDLRIRFALERLADGSADLSRIALDCGFSSHSHFTACVRQRLGYTPSALREMLAT